MAVNLDHAETEDRHFDRLADNHTLKELQLVGTVISDDGYRTLGKLSDLETLDLRATFIGDEGLIDLADLTSLKRLRATGSRVTRAGLDELKRTIPALKVEWFPKNTPICESDSNRDTTSIRRRVTMPSTSANGRSSRRSVS